MYNDLLINEILNSDVFKFKLFSKERSKVTKIEHKPSIVTVKDKSQELFIN